MHARSRGSRGIGRRRHGHAGAHCRRRGHRRVHHGGRARRRFGAAHDRRRRTRRHIRGSWTSTRTTTARQPGDPKYTSPLLVLARRDDGDPAATAEWASLPVAADQRDWLIELMEGVEDIPGSALAEGISWEWESFDEYLDALERMPRAIDVGTHVPHAAMRAYVMGSRAHELATADDLEAMQAIVRSALRAGALGVSTGRTAGHRDVHGAPVPGTFAAEHEVAALLQAMVDEDRGVLQLVPAGISGELRRARWRRARCNGARARMVAAVRRGVLETDHVPDHATRRRPRPLAAVVHRGRRGECRGAALHPQVASRCFGVLMGHQSRVNPFQYFGSYRPLMDLPFDARDRARCTGRRCGRRS